MKVNVITDTGKIAAQCSHAAISCYREGMNICPEVVKMWVSEGQTKIVLRSESPGEENLIKIGRKASSAGLIVSLIRDAGRTQISSGTATVIGIGPAYTDKINQVTSHLKML